MTRKLRPLVSLLLLLLHLLLEQAVIRNTLNVCVVALCKWTATAFVEGLFSHHPLPLYVFTGALNVALIGYGIHLVMETLEEHFKIPIRGWLEWLYKFLMPKGGDVKPEGSPPKQKRPARKKTLTAKRRKPRARSRPAKAALGAADPEESLPAADPPPPEPRRVPRGDKNQGLES